MSARPICGPRCRHATKWTKLPSGKFGQLRACQTDEHARGVALVREAMAQPGGVFGPMPADLVAALGKAGLS